VQLWLFLMVNKLKPDLFFPAAKKLGIQINLFTPHFLFLFFAVLTTVTNFYFYFYF